MKINTNASLLNEKKIHAILSGGVTTIVFSADAADSELYAKLRVNGKLEKVLKNIELFNKIKETKYKNSKIISRVSGVKVGENQKIGSVFLLLFLIPTTIIFHLFPFHQRAVFINLGLTGGLIIAAIRDPK